MTRCCKARHLTKNKLSSISSETNEVKPASNSDTLLGILEKKTKRKELNSLTSNRNLGAH